MNNSRLWMANIPRAATKESIKELFEPCGELDEIIYDEEKNYAFIRMDYKANAEKALQKLDKMDWMGNVLTVQFSNPSNSIKLRNLSPFVTNELLKVTFNAFGDVEKAVVVIDDRGKPTGEGIIEFNRKSQALFALKHCNQNMLFLTTSPRPVIAEPLVATYDGDGYKERTINKKTKRFFKERQNGPRFGVNGTFEYVYGKKWKQLYEVFDSKRKCLEKEFLQHEQYLIEELEISQYEYETELLKQQVREREAAMDYTQSRRNNKPRSKYSTDFMSEYNNDNINSNNSKPHRNYQNYPQQQSDKRK